MTSEEIKRQFSGQQSQPETHDKTIDQIIRENNVDDGKLKCEAEGEAEGEAQGEGESGEMGSTGRGKYV